MSQERSLITAGREYDESQKHHEDLRKSRKVQNLTWNNKTNKSGLKQL